MSWIVLGLALALDRGCGDPPSTFHPVAWFGRFVGLVERHLLTGSPRFQLCSGAALAFLGVLVAATAAYLLERIVAVRAGGGFTAAHIRGLVVLAALLKTTFAWRGLLEAGEHVRDQIERGRLLEARLALRSLVSRDTSKLEISGMSAAVIESLAENASDSVVAPVFYYLLCGLPGAFAYRAVNTMDAMIGYHGRYEYFGKVAARLDDALSWIPSRVTAAAIAVVSLARTRRATAWRIARRDHGLTESPNAGYPMSAMAGALGVALEKVGHYQLNGEARAAGPDDIRGARRLIEAALGVAIATGILIWSGWCWLWPHVI